jgi:hypothetical protein
VAAHGRDQIFRVGVFQACLRTGVLDVKVEGGPVQRVAIGLCGFGCQVVGLLLGLQLAQALLQLSLLAVGGGADALFRLADGLAQCDGGIALGFSLLPTRGGRINSGGEFGCKVTFQA